MISTDLRHLAAALRRHPALVGQVAVQIEHHAEEVAALEALVVPRAARGPAELPEGVVSLAARREARRA